jgi:hypothetical protein
MTDPVQSAQPGTQASASSDSDAFAAIQVVLRERQGRDRGWWQQMEHTFWPDSKVRLSWYDGPGAGFVSGSRTMRDAGLVTLHHVYAPVAQVRGAKAHVEAPTAIRAVVDVDDVGCDLTAYTRLNYRMHRRDGQWGILFLDAIYEYTTLVPSIPGETINIGADDLAGFRASYRLLAWSASHGGRAMSGELLGDDRPEAVDAYYAETLAWLES